MKNEAFVGHLLTIIYGILKSVGLAPFSYLKSKPTFVRCKFSTNISFAIGGLIILLSLPLELMSAIHFKPIRVNTVTYTIGYLHILFTLVRIWLNQILTITNRNHIINHFNRAIYINQFVRRVCQLEHILDDKLTGKIKLRILFFIFQCFAIIHQMLTSVAVSSIIRRA